MVEKMSSPRISSGEIGISTKDKDYRFRPSLSAMASLGSPSDIVELFGLLHSSPAINPYYPVESFRKWERSIIAASIEVLAACCADDVTPLVGHVGSRYGSWVPGAIPVEDMPHLARSLMRHGITGNAKPKGKPKADDYAATFDAKEFAATAMAHLGMDADAAWSLTMTEFIAAMQSKFGKPEQNIDDLLENRDRDMAWLESVNKLRDRKVV